MQDLYFKHEIPSLSEGTDGEIERYGVSLVPLPLHSIDTHLFPPLYSSPLT